VSGFRHGQVWGAERIGRALVARRLAACVNLLAGVVSIYRWKGRCSVTRSGCW
jgi:uncharacterized protein involved in tolerance to divalent cations